MAIKKIYKILFIYKRQEKIKTLALHDHKKKKRTKMKRGLYLKFFPAIGGCQQTP